MTHKKYFWVLLVATLISALVFKFTLINSARCDAFGGGPGKFMAYCNVDFHGHYDHAAYLFNLEDGLTTQVQNANLLFLGSSRSQFAFSTSALTKFILQYPAVRPYLLGFGHVEQDVFAAEILQRMKPNPSVVVINADPFFANIISAHAKQLLKDETLEKQNAHIKKFWHPISEAACNGHIPLVGGLICGNHDTVYRSAEDGRWIAGKNHLPTIPVNDLQPSSQDEAALKLYVKNAEAFLSKLNVARRCVVLTYVPTVNGKPFIARGISDQLGIKFIAPKLDGLFTYDRSHLDTISSERWSQAFLTDLKPVLATCLP